MAAHAVTQPLHVLESPNPEVLGDFGYSVSSAGDVNNDGYDDIIVGAFYEDGSEPDCGRAYVFSGYDAGLLHRLESPNPEINGYFGISVSGAGDVNGDGYDDIVVGAYFEDGGATNAGRAYVFDGNSGTPLDTLQSLNPEEDGFFGFSVSGAGDVNNDSYDDVIIGAWAEDYSGIWYSGRAYIYSGINGEPLYTLNSPYPGYFAEFGISVSAAGDVNNDGYDDVIVGADFEYHETAFFPGKAHVFSGNGGGVLYTLQSANMEENGHFGCSVSGAGDTNGDGYPDLVIGARYESPGSSPPSAGRAYIFSGDGGELLQTLQSPDQQSFGLFGSSVAMAGDVNNDGYHDVIVGAYYEYDGIEDAGKAHVFRGDTGDLLITLESASPEVSGHFGRAVSSAGDVNNDSYHDVIVGATGEDGGVLDAGRAYVLTLAPPSITLSCVLTEGNLLLQWTPCPGASEYWVYGADNQPYFNPELLPPYQHRLVVLLPPSTSWVSPNGISDPLHNWSYLVVAAGAFGEELCASSRVGEFDYGLEITVPTRWRAP